MLPKINRLRKTKDIEDVFKRGKGYKEGFLFLKLIKNNLGVSRFAFIVSKKVAKKSAARNKIKRTLRVAVGVGLPNIKTGLDAVMVVLRGIKKEDLKQIKETTERVFKKAKII